jgi:hypothetical protein
VVFPDARKGKQNSTPDLSVIKKSHDERWLLLTYDREMKKTHVEEIKRHPCCTVLATAHGSTTHEENDEWYDAVIKLKPTILRLRKKQQRPWFAIFSKAGNITSCETITPSHTTRRTKKK